MGTGPGRARSFVAAGGTTATITVLNTADAGAGSLRAAIAAAASGDTIDLSGLAGTITLTSGELLIDKSLTITGPGADILTVTAGGASRVFHVENAGTTVLETVSISRLTIRGGAAPSTGGGVYDVGENLTLDRVYVTNNTAADNGGGLFLNADSGGAPKATFTITNSTIANNTTGAGGNGPGAGVTISNAAVATPATLQNVTIANNTNDINANGAGLNLFNSQVSVLDSTIAGNTVSGTGVGAGLAAIGSTITLTNSVIANNISPGAEKDVGLGGSAVNATDSLVRTPGSTVITAGAGYLTGVDPLLGALGLNGGTIPNMLPGAGSPLLNAGQPGGGGLPALDERGLARVSGGRVDIGAIEVQVTTPLAGDDTNRPPPSSPPKTPSWTDLDALFKTFTGVEISSPWATAQKLTLANGQSITNLLFTESLLTFKYQGDFRAGQLNLPQAFEAMLDFAAPAAAVALETYRFFTGAFPTLTGEAWLLNPSINASALDGPKYYGMSEANRYINVSVSLATGTGAGAADFARNYGSLTFAQAAAKAYDTIIGTAYARAAGIDPDKALAYVVGQQAYFQTLGGSDIGAKAAAAAAGYLMSVGFDNHLGLYFMATHDALAAQVTIAGQPAPTGFIPLFGYH